MPHNSHTLFFEAVKLQNRLTSRFVSAYGDDGECSSTRRLFCLLRLAEKRTERRRDWLRAETNWSLTRGGSMPAERRNRIIFQRSASSGTGAD